MKITGQTDLHFDIIAWNSYISVQRKLKLHPMKNRTFSFETMNKILGTRTCLSQRQACQFHQILVGSAYFAHDRKKKRHRTSGFAEFFIILIKCVPLKQGAMGWNHPRVFLFCRYSYISSVSLGN